MKSQGRTDWVVKGYQLAAEIGLSNVNIELISRFMKKNKSSFYHYFGDLLLFEQEMLTYHISRSEEFASKINDVTTIKPDLLDLAIVYKYDIFFHKQLRLNRDIERYEACFQVAFKNYETAVRDKWAKFFGLEKNVGFVSMFIHFFTENLLLKITFERFSVDWLEGYLNELIQMLQQMDKN